MTDNKHDEAVAMLRQALRPLALADIDASGTAACGVTRADIVRAAEVYEATAALNTRPDVEADMRERCALVAETIVGDRDGVPERIRIATAIRSLPLSNKGESR